VLVEYKVEGASQKVITWNQWWDLKKETNADLVDAIKR